MGWFITTIDSVIADFTKAVTKLERLAESHLNTAADHKNMAEENESLHQFHQTEAIRAKQIALNINKIIGV